MSDLIYRQAVIDALDEIENEVIGWVVHDFANAYMAERREK